MSFKKIINITLIAVFSAFSLLVCFKHFNQSSPLKESGETLQIYELWHVESFEGGGANRANYLKNIALEYEKLNPTKLFMIKTIEADQIEEALSKSTPHLISFAEQVAKTVLPQLIEFDDEYGVKDNYIQSAKYNGKLMAIPFIASGYCYFTKANSPNNLSLYTANNNLHNALSVISNTEINNSQTLSSYECYTKFVNSNNIKLLGTGRDLYRIKNLESLGRFSVQYEPVSTFTDLVQYLGVTTNNKDVLNFVDFVMQSSNQQKLTALSLFSTQHISLYTEPTYSSMEQALSKCNVPNIFN